MVSSIEMRKLKGAALEMKQILWFLHRGMTTLTTPETEESAEFLLGTLELL